MLEKARKYEKVESAKIAKESRPAFHFSNPVGWMNDPNGFSDYKGEHHLFFQYYPYATHWDSMHWGHAKVRILSSGNTFQQHWLQIRTMTILVYFPVVPLKMGKSRY